VRNEKRNYVVVGTFVIAMVAVLIVWVSLMAGQLGDTDRYTVVYSNTGKLKPGARVLFEGFPIGRIAGIQPIDRDAQRVFRVDVDVERGWPIPTNSSADITTGIFSAAEIDIARGDAQNLLAPGSEISAAAASDIFAALNTTVAKVGPILDELGQSTPELMQSAQELISELNESADQIKQILNPENVRRVSSILENFDQATGEMSRLLNELRILGENTDILLGRLDGLLDRETGGISKAIDDAQYSLAAVSQRIDAVTSDLESTMRNLNEFSRQLRMNPGVLLRGREATVDGSSSQ
jgi:phospholipid/cholesterol/gamma-HCH transport system substrate-binding protein